MILLCIAQPFISDIAGALAKPRAWEGQRPRCPRFAVARATRTLPLPGFASVSMVYEIDEISEIVRVLRIFHETENYAGKL